MSHRLQRTLALMMVMGLLSVLLAACSQSDKEKGNDNRTATSATPAAGNIAPASSSAEPKKIDIDNYAFKPAQLTIPAGTKVTWMNKDKIAHTATSNDKRFDSGLIGTNAEFSYTFTASGTYGYHCTPHPRMTGQIIVK